ncbi:MAG: DUF1573 domain-containing protein [Victivallales bacterium]|jgi:hypothetical protein|nr:DUF1573 domain-containing protein [Victivallales bacterium]
MIHDLSATSDQLQGNWIATPDIFRHKLEQGKKYFFSFELRNNTSKALTIGRIYPGCAACTKIQPYTPKELKPSGSVIVSFSFRKRISGNFAYSIWITEKDSLLPPKEIKLFMTIANDYEISSQQISDVGNSNGKFRFFEIYVKGKKKFDPASLAKTVKIISRNYKLSSYELIPSREGYFEAKIIIFCDLTEFRKSSYSSRVVICFDDLLELEHKF